MQQERLFVHVNDSIRGLATEGPATQSCEFMCECPEVSCHAMVTLTVAEFDQRRPASPPIPILATDHTGQADKCGT